MKRITDIPWKNRIFFREMLDRHLTSVRISLSSLFLFSLKIKKKKEKERKRINYKISSLTDDNGNFLFLVAK